MNLSRRLRSLLILLFSASVLLTLVLLFTVDRGSFSQLQDLADRLRKSDKERQQVAASERALEPMSLMAGQVCERRDDLMDGVQQLASDGAMRALYASAHPESAVTKSSPTAKPENLQQILLRWATAKKNVWDGADLTDKAGHVLASWPANVSKGQDLSKEAVFIQLSSSGSPLGIPAFEFVKNELGALKGKDQKISQGVGGGHLILACGIEGADGNFAGLLRVKAPVDKLFGLGLENFLKPLRAVSSKSVLILMRGSGEQVFHSGKGAYAENFDRMGQEFKSAMAAMQAQDDGWLPLASYDGKPSLLVWKRVGAWQASVGTSSLLTLVALLPEEDFRPFAAGASVSKPAPFWARPMTLLLLVLAFAAPLGVGLAWLTRETAPLARLMDVASQIDEQGALPEGLEFRQETGPTMGHVSSGLNALVSLSRTATERLHELDGALSRAEEQASHDATRAAQELADSRSKLSKAEAEKNSAVDALKKSQQEAEIQSGILRNSLEASQRDVEAKNLEIKNLSIQIQDLGRALDEKLKSPEPPPQSGNGVQRDEELVRLSAVNTLSGELKATLLVIKNYVSSMLGSSGAVSEQQQEFLGVVINKSARLERLIADLVELSEISSGTKPLHLEKSRLASILEEGMQGVRPQADQKNISLELAGKESGAEVSVDRDRFGGVVRTLIGQAIKVTSRNERVTVAISGDDHHCEIRISDPGMNLTPDRAAKVFNQFHGVDSQAGPEFIGTGLRFSIMRAVIEAHAGKIWIESQPGRGKAFVLSLPVAGSSGVVQSPPLSGLPQPAAASAAKPSAVETAAFDSIFGEMPAPAALPQLPAIPAKPLGKALLKEDEKAGFDAIFGTPSPPSAASPVLPAVEFKTEAAKAPLPEKDMANFAAIFGAPPKLVGPPPAPGAVPAPPPKPAIPAELANFEAIFGSPAGPRPASPPPPPLAPKPGLGSSGMDDLNNMFK